MRDLFKFEKRHKYPHMSQAEAAIWSRFIEKYPDIYKECQYDFHVGDAPHFNTLDDDDNDTNQDMLYRLRIDVVAHADDHIAICELKENAGSGAVGQCENYKIMYMRDEEPKKEVRCVIVTDRVKPNTEYLAKEKGVSVFIV